MNILDPVVPSIFNPRRKDKYVQELSVELGTYLSWLSHPYGRAYKLDKKVNEIRETYPAVYNANGNYIPVDQNSFLTGSCYFILGKTDYLEDTIVQFPMSIIFMVNLKKIYPTVTEYQSTERLIEQAEHVLRVGYPQFKFESQQDEFEEIFNEFSEPRLNELKRFPLDSFRINGTFTLYLECLGVDVYPGDQGPLTGTIDVVGWGDNDTVGWGDGDELGWGDN